MYTLQIAKTSLVAFLLLSSSPWLEAQTSEAKTKPDNSAVNKRDRSSGATTADQQKMNAADRALTAKIRRSIIADKSLSMYAHNVKIISQDGTVTLKGPVRSAEEVKAIESKAITITGDSGKVVNEMSVAPPSKP